jgi:hypothetical protein
VVASLELWSRAALQPLAATIALTGLTLVAHGFERRERRLGYLGVALLEAGYMVQLMWFDVGQPQAFAVPAGLYLLAVGYFEWRRGAAGRIKPALEIAGLALLLGISLVQAVGFLGAGYERYVYDTFLFLECLALLGLGAVLRWLRTFTAGAVGLIVSVVLLLADPVGAMDGVYRLMAAGLALIAIVAFLQWRRQQIPDWIEHGRVQLEAWD